MQFPRIASLLTVWVALGLAGCAEKTTGPCCPETADTQGAQDRIRQLESELAAATSAGARDRGEMARLQAELNDLRRQLAERPQPAPAPAPAPAPGWDTVPGGAMTSIEGTILFDSGKAVLKPSARSTLESVARVINEKYADYDVYVFGHTDDEPIRRSGWKDNYELSAQRALSVVRMLRSMTGGVKMAAAGWGEQLPVAANTNAAARQRNRRVEIYAMAPVAGRGAEASPPSGVSRGEAALEPGATPAARTSARRSTEKRVVAP